MLIYLNGKKLDQLRQIFLVDLINEDFEHIERKMRNDGVVNETVSSDTEEENSREAIE